MALHSLRLRLVELVAPRKALEQDAATRGLLGLSKAVLVVKVTFKATEH